MINDGQQGKPRRKIGFHELSMMDLPSVDQDAKGIDGRKNSAEERDQGSSGRLPSLGILKNSSGSKKDLRKRIANQDLPLDYISLQRESERSQKNLKIEQ